ncbi:MAG: preprotein translocase subunit SecE [Bacilli bacterium]|jgi:preprotein translocase SecE subunit|nr:preprotein translocase subunit SecE [Bacilli bacterium]MCI2110982.1 preprotein translocase subunit SecE [Bacilli bacterium]
MAAPHKYLKEVVKEGKRVRWPNRETLWPAIAVVIWISVFAALFLVLEDLAASSIISQLQSAFGG